jgi:hypothetical protein
VRSIKEQILIEMGGESYLREIERQKELAHARELAAIRRGDSPDVPAQPIAADPPSQVVRLSATITCPAAARKLEAYLNTHGLGLTAFAIQAQTTDRTLRRFRKSGTIRRDIFESIAHAMKMTKEELMGE